MGRYETVFAAAVCLFLTACSGGMSQRVREEATPVAGLEELRRNLESYVGETVILGGEIIEVRNESMEETTILVLERPLGVARKPKLESESGGRFMARFERYLDPEVFTEGLAVTVGGVVEGTVTEPVGKAPYQYVVLGGRDLHGWRTYEGYYNHPAMYYPYYPYGRLYFHGGYWLP